MENYLKETQDKIRREERNKYQSKLKEIKDRITEIKGSEIFPNDQLTTNFKLSKLEQMMQRLKEMQSSENIGINNNNNNYNLN